MTDTTPGITAKQIEIMLAKSESERFRIGDELIEFGRILLESAILREIPGISESELKIAVFTRCYASFFPPEQLQMIILSMREYCQRQQILQEGKP